MTDVHMPLPMWHTFGVKTMKKLLVLSLMSFASLVTAGELTYPQDMPQAQFAAQHIQEALQKNNMTSLSVTLVLGAEHLGEQAYRITREGDTITVTGGDARGVMYGGLELAERIRHQKLKNLTDMRGKPFIEKRGIKFNIPLDARTPSYADCGHAALYNIAEMWNWDFWTEFMDNMALHRYNTLTLWNPHPFPVMTKIEGYEDVALSDVCVCTMDLFTQKHLWGPVQLVSEQVMDNLKVVKTITIEQKIDFWRKVMRYGKDRGIDIYFITWNICPNSVAQPVKPDYESWSIQRQEETPGKYGISHQINNPKTLAYYRQAVKTFIETYPDLKGIGVTSGEHMPDDQPGLPYTRENWVWQAYGLGVLDAKKEHPERTVHFIHRVWNSDMKNIMQIWGQYPDAFDVSFKYAKARLYSSPEIPFADRLLKDLKQYKLKSWWNLRNDDIFIHRWGDPDYVRAFLKNFPQDYTAGYHMGSDGYVWGREFVTKDASQPPQLEITKHWYRFMLWGRLGYDPSLERGYFLDVLRERFPDESVPLLYDTWQAASKVIPLVNRFHWCDWDYMWAVEGCKDGAGYRTVVDFYDNPTMQKSGILNPKDYVLAVLAKKEISATTPLGIAEKLDSAAGDALQGTTELLKQASPELTATVRDCRAMALLGQFYADKIRATVAYGFYKETGKEQHQAQALQYLRAGAKHWTDYTKLSESRYKSQVLARTGVLDWAQLRKDAEDEIRMVEELEPGN